MVAWTMVSHSSSYKAVLIRAAANLKYRGWSSPTDL